jgi:hypothetical protein
MLRFGAVLLCALTAASCGGEKATTTSGTDLTVTVRPRGPDGPVRRRHIECHNGGPQASQPACPRLAHLGAAMLEPVPAGTACAQIYGGPATARVQGTLHGKRVDATFERSDGCQIERWDRNRVLLGDG